MKNIRHILYCLLHIILAASCAEDRLPSGGQLADVPCVLNVDKSAISFLAQGSSTELDITSKNVDWKLAGAPSWLTLSQVSGTGAATVAMTAAENKDVDKARVAVLQLESTTARYEYSTNITVDQEAAKIYLDVDRTSLSFTPQTTQANVAVNTNIEWEPVCTAAWLALSKTDAATLSVKAGENTTDGSRTATITLRRVGTATALATIVVVQSEAGVTGTTETVVLDVDGGTKSIDIEADVTWSATSSATSWLSVTPTSGVGGKVELKISALANKSTAARSGFVYVKIGSEQKLAIPVSQEGVSLNVNASLKNFAADGSIEQKLTVESNTAWVVLSCPEWLTVTPEQAAKGSTEITLRASENNSLNSRSATLRIGIEGLSIYKDITVAQEPVVADLGDSSIELGWESSQREVEIVFPGSWSAIVTGDWISLSQSSGNGGEIILVTAKVNDGEDARQGSVTIASEGRSIKISVIQQGQYLKINSTAGEVGAMGGSVSLTVTTSVGATAVVEYEDEAKDWVAFDSDDNGIFTLQVSYNPSANSRTAQFVIKPTMSTTNTACTSGVKFAVTQRGRALAASVSAIAISVAGGESATYTITADSTYTITKPEIDDWYTLQQDSANCTFSIAATENTTGAERSSLLTVSLTGLPKDEVHSIDVEILQYDEYNGYEFVDLGLPSGVKWATCNVGATQSHESGSFYAWGETEEKENYDWSTYKWCGGSETSMTKYCTSNSSGTVDNKTVLAPEDDAAHVNWGGCWRMPTYKEQKELIDNCTWTWITQYGVEGYKVTGTNGNSIFLPAVTGNSNRGMTPSNVGGYWSNTLVKTLNSCAYHLYFDESGSFDIHDSYNRCNARSVRPVCGGEYTVSVSSEGNGSVSINGKSGASAKLGATSAVTLIATPDEAYAFEGWYVDGTETPVSTNAEYTFTVSEDIALVAKFSKKPVVKISCNDDGAVSFKEHSGDSIVVSRGTELTIVATPDEAYAFEGWYVYGTESPVSTNAEYTFTVSEDIALVAKFSKKPVVKISCNDGGAVSFKEHSGDSIVVSRGTELTIVATPDEAYAFEGWYVDGTEPPVSTNAEYTFTVSEDIALVAKFNLLVYEAVDLGLPSGIKWATFNVGATRPEEYGGYYAWGETKEKDNYDWSTYKWCNGSYNSITKYCTRSDYGTIDNKTTLDPEDDVAHVKWGDSWRMPTSKEQQELLDNCTWKWTTQNGVNGYKVTSKSNGNSIFLPAAGYRSGITLYAKNSEGRIWSSLLYTKDGSHSANALRFYSGTSYACNSFNRNLGLSVRPVCGEWRKFSVSVGSEANGSVAISGYSGTSAILDVSSKVTVIATPDEGYSFSGWYTGSSETLVSTNAEYTFTVIEDVALVARFEVNEPGSSNGDYYVKYGADVMVGSHRYPRSVGIVGAQSPQQQLDDIASASSHAAYFDKTSTVFEVKSGETVTPTILYTGFWMHGYVFVDWDNSKQFEVNLEGDGPFTKGEGNELMCWSFYGKDGEEIGWNSAGASLGVEDWSVAPGSFRVPDGLATGSTYRMRFAIMWNCIDPSGDYERFIDDGGAIIDVTLKIVGESSVEPEPDDDSSASDYYVVHGADVNVTHSAHYPKSVGIVGTHTPQQSLNNIATAPGCAAYFDKSSTVFEVKSGELVEPRISINGTWMHGYVFVDWDSSKQFEVNLEGNGPYTKGEGNELMSWSCYYKNNDGLSGWNSSGTFIENSCLAINPGEFRVPAGLKDGSTYRMRFAIQWNSIDPSGSYANFISDGGSIIDVTLKIIGDADDETDPSPFDSDKLYTISSQRAFLLYQPSTNALVASTGTAVNAEQNPQDPNQQFQIKRNSSGYQLYSVGAGGYAVYQSLDNVRFDPNAGSKLTITETGNSDYPWKLQLGDYYLNTQDGRHPTGLKVDTWSYTDAGNSYILEEVVPPVTHIVSVSSEGKGSVTISGNSGTSVAAREGSSVTVIAMPYAGYAFDGWYIDGSEEPVSTDAEYTFTVSEDVALTARFVQIVCEAVDLGLPSGLKWAAYNVGATKPEEYGGYYAWGETEEKEDYSWSTYKWCNGSENTMTKYCTDSSYGTVDNKTVLDPEDDVAHVKWGGSWRMPTKAEQDELRNSCTWTWTTQNGVKGYKVTSKSNGNSIFLPDAGDRYGTNLGSDGNYWSGSLDGSSSHNAYLLFFYRGYYDWKYRNRCDGRSVRPVSE